MQHNDTRAPRRGRGNLQRNQHFAPCRREPAKTVSNVGPAEVCRGVRRQPPECRAAHDGAVGPVAVSGRRNATVEEERTSLVFRRQSRRSAAGSAQPRGARFTRTPSWSPALHHGVVHNQQRVGARERGRLSAKSPSRNQVTRSRSSPLKREEEIAREMSPHREVPAAVMKADRRFVVRPSEESSVGDTCTSPVHRSFAVDHPVASSPRRRVQ